MASFSPISGIAVAGQTAAAGGGGPITVQSAWRGAGAAVARLAMQGAGSAGAKGSAGSRAHAYGRAGAPLRWWVSRRQKSYLGR